jgi:HD superfamily phosphodiesterase
MNLTVPIESAERQFKQIIEDFFITVFYEGSLLSHGIDHHRRVWNYSKVLLHLIADQNLSGIMQLPEKLIIACYFHDTGMSVEPGIKHGIHSRDICIRFLELNHLDSKDNSDILEAIEYHDIKDYSSNKNANELLKILSLADDLDAFGFTGIYRYTEIYLIRGISQLEIGHLIRKNASGRFENFKKTVS